MNKFKKKKQNFYDIRNQKNEPFNKNNLFLLENLINIYVEQM